MSKTVKYDELKVKKGSLRPPGNCFVRIAMPGGCLRSLWLIQRIASQNAHQERVDSAQSVADELLEAAELMGMLEDSDDLLLCKFLTLGG